MYAIRSYYGGLLEIRLVSPMMESSSVYLSATLLLLAGAYQFSPLKNACLQHCRSPLGFLLTVITSYSIHYTKLYEPP